MRQFCRSLVVSFPLFLLIAGLFFFHIDSVSAQATTGADKIGTHLIQGDYNAQADVIRKLIASGVLSKNPAYPIVVMIDPANPGGLSIIKTAIGSNGFQVILRVNVHENTPSSQIPGVVKAITDNFSGPDYPVVVGNEINNQNTKNGEWKSQSYTAYGQMFESICRGVRPNPCGIAALDTINSDFDVEAILPRILSSITDKTLITAVFANVYKTADCSWISTRCDVTSGAWIQSKIKAGVPLYITEFGTTTCGDYDCLQEFYEANNDISAKAVVGFSRPPGEATGTTWVHPVPAICEYWLAGPGLAVEKPTKCGGGKRQAFVYPGIEDMSPDETRMRQMAAGYTLMCGNQFKVQGSIDNEDAIARYNENVADNQKIDCGATPTNAACIIGGVWGNVILDNTKTVIPLYRFQGAQVPNPEGATRRFDDLEGFFGANYTKGFLENASGGQQFLPSLANGVSRKLVSQQTQCEMTVGYLKTIKQLCDQEGNRSGYTYNDKLDADAKPATPSALPPGDCALYSKIPGAPAQFDTYKKVFEQMPSNFSCSIPETAPPAWYKEFSKIEITIPKGFKPAYLVHYIDRPEEQPSGLDKKVNWMAPGEDDNSGTNDDRNISDRIKIVKVYVPAGFAETNIDEVNKNPALSNRDKQPSFFPTFTGGFMQTIESIIPFTTRTRIITDRLTKTESIVKDMDTAGIFDGSHGGIACKTCNTKAPTNALDPRFTIIRRINAEFLDPDTQTCSSDDFVGETAQERVHTINPAGTIDPVKPAKITASATLVAQKPGNDQETIRTYLLLPEEFRNITDYERELLNTFISVEQQDVAKFPEFDFISNRSEMASKPKAAFKYLQLTGATADMISPKVEGSTIRYYETDNDAEPIYDPITGTASQPQRAVDAKLSGQITADRGLSEIKPDPQVPGGILARSLWEVMCNVTRPFNNIPTVPYAGFEKFLQKGMAACTDGAQPNSGTETPSTTDALAYMNTEVVKCDRSMSAGMTPGNGIPVQYSSYICTAKDGPANSVDQPASQFTPTVNIPAWVDRNDGDSTLCSPKLYNSVVCSYSPERRTPHYALIAHKVDASGNFTPNGTMTACEYIVQQAQSRGVSPKLALAIFGDESGFGAYSTPATADKPNGTGQDFGVISQPSSRVNGSIAIQTGYFINTVNSHRSSSYLNFLRAYSGEKTVTLTNFCNNRAFPYRVKDFYDTIGRVYR